MCATGKWSKLFLVSPPWDDGAGGGGLLSLMWLASSVVHLSGQVLFFS
jgi:hypothetical protein